MAVVDPYSSCPCGSGQKFKWCCQKVEPFAERAERLFEGGQIASAIGALDEGLRKDPSNAWLLTRKAVYLIQKHEPEAAREALLRMLQKQPKHLGGLALLTRLDLELDGPKAGVERFQQTLSALEGESRPALASMARLVAAFLTELDIHPAALKHLELAESLAARPGGAEEAADPNLATLRRSIESDPTVSPFQKEPYRLAPAPEGLTPDARARFEEALGWADQGLWSASATAFELLSAEPAANPAADRNLGLCRLWLADDEGAVEALRRAIRRMGTSTEAVDLEAICQDLPSKKADEQVEHVQWIWPLRDREALLKTLRDDPLIVEEGEGPVDLNDPDSPEVDHFTMLDRPIGEAVRGRDTREIARVVARVFVGQEIAGLDTYDDGRLDALGDRFTAMAGASIAPAHPKTKVLGTIARSVLALSIERLLPEGLPRDEQARLTREQEELTLREDWPKTPMPFLGGRSPRDAASAGDAVVPLRAALLRLEHMFGSQYDSTALSDLRADLKLDPEPEVDPATVDVDRLPLARFAYVAAGRLDDARLAAYYKRARRYMLRRAVEAASRALLDRPAAAEAAKIEPIQIHTDLAYIAAARDEHEASLDWIRRGRQADPAAARARNAPVWDLLELRLRARAEEPEAWVPELAVILERYRDNPEANQVIMMSLVEMGLVRMVPRGEGSDEFMIDPRPLQVLLSEYGPRVTTASGQLGVAATKGEIWTPGSDAGGAGGAGGAIWTPGSGASPAAAPPGGERSKLIIPGR